MDKIVEQQAAYWLEQEDNLSPLEQDLFQKWLNTDQEHFDTYKKLKAIYVSDELTVALSEFREKQSTIATTRYNSGSQHIETNKSSRFWQVSQIGVLATMLFAVVAFILPSQPEQTTIIATAELSPSSKTRIYQTAVGERRSITAKDGSHIHLNAATDIEIVQSDKARQAKISSGEAYFDIARDESRPFTVKTPMGEIRVLGTIFNVEQRTDTLTVKVDEGHVQVTGDRTVNLYADQMVTLRKGKVGPVEQINTESAAKWRSGWLQVQAQPIDELIAQLQRYVDKPIILKLDSSQVPKISGRFALDQAPDTLALLASLNDLTLIEESEAIYLE